MILKIIFILRIKADKPWIDINIMMIILLRIWNELST